MDISLRCRVRVLEGDPGNVDCINGKGDRVLALWSCPAEHGLTKKTLGMWNENWGFYLYLDMRGMCSRKVIWSVATLLGRVKGTFNIPNGHLPPYLT